MNTTTKAEQTALTVPQRAAVALGAAEHEVKLRGLVKSSADIVAVIDPAGRDQAHRIGMTLKTARVSIEKTGKAAREDATAFSKAVIAEEKRLVGLIVPEEGRVLSLRDQFDAAEQRRKDALIAAERARTDAIQADIEQFRRIPQLLIGKSVADLAFALKDMCAMVVTKERFAEFDEDAAKVVADVITAIEGLHTKAVESEAAALAAEEARKAEAARFEQERAALAAQRVENERIANEQAAERQRLADLAAAQEAAAKKLRDQAEASLRAEREAQELAMRLEREKAAKEQAERDRVAADTKRQLEAQAAQIAADRKAMEEERAAAAQLIADHAEAILMDSAFNAERGAQLERDHAEALIDNAQFDADRATNLARCTETAKAMHANGPRLIADSIATYIDAGMAEDSNDEPFIDYEAIAWAYAKLLAYGVGNTGMDNAMMLDRLNLMLLTAEA